MKTVKTFRAGLLACALVLLAPLTAQAEVILQTATAIPGDIGDYTATTFNQRVIGADFTLTHDSHVTSVGFGSGRFGGGTLFGAIVPVDPITGFPLASFDNLASTALGFTLINELATAGDVSGALSLDLAAGTYGVLFGSGQFGATGVGAFTESTAIGDPTMFESFFGSAFSVRSNDVRLFVTGEVPEPASIVILLAGLAGLGWLVGRRRKDAIA